MTRTFFKIVQNTMHYAVSHKTAAEIVYERADAERPHMGLTTWKNAPDGRVVRSDVTIVCMGTVSGRNQSGATERQLPAKRLPHSNGSEGTQRHSSVPGVTIIPTPGTAWQHTGRWRRGYRGR